MKRMLKYFKNADTYLLTVICRLFIKYKLNNLIELFN